MEINGLSRGRREDQREDEKEGEKVCDTCQNLEQTSKKPQKTEGTKTEGAKKKGWTKKA